MLHAGRLGPLTLVLAPDAGVTARYGGEVVGREWDTGSIFCSPGGGILIPFLGFPVAWNPAFSVTPLPLL